MLYWFIVSSRTKPRFDFTMQVENMQNYLNSFSHGASWIAHHIGWKHEHFHIWKQWSVKSKKQKKLLCLLLRDRELELLQFCTLETRFVHTKLRGANGSVLIAERELVGCNVLQLLRLICTKGFNAIIQIALAQHAL